MRIKKTSSTVIETSQVLNNSNNSTTDTYSCSYSNSQFNNKQDTLVSGTNIKTINNQSILGSGNITIQGSGGSTDWGDIGGTLSDQTDLQNQLYETGIIRINTLSGSPMIWVGTETEYNNLATKYNNIFYFIKE